MVFYILIAIVFIAELIISFAVISKLLSLDKKFNEISEMLCEAKPKIKSITEISKKISEQLVELAPLWVEKIKDIFINIAINHLKSMMTGVLIWAIRQKLKNN